MFKISILFLALSYSLVSCATSVVMQEDVGVQTYDAQAREVAQQYIGMARAYDIRLRKEVALHAVAKRYVDFLEQFGAADQGDIKALMASLFVDDCHKVVNGKVITHTIDELYNQIAKAKEVVGTWSVKIVNPVMVNTETSTVVIHYEIPTQEAGTFVVMKFLTVDNGFIAQINEVYNALDNIAESLHQITD